MQVCGAVCVCSRQCRLCRGVSNSTPFLVFAKYVGTKTRAKIPYVLLYELCCSVGKLGVWETVSKIYCMVIMAIITAPLYAFTLSSHCCCTPLGSLVIKLDFFFTFCSCFLRVLCFTFKIFTRAYNIEQHAHLLIYAIHWKTQLIFTSSTARIQFCCIKLAVCLKFKT